MENLHLLSLWFQNLQTQLSYSLRFAFGSILDPFVNYFMNHQQKANMTLVFCSFGNILGPSIQLVCIYCFNLLGNNNLK